ncbi:MAG: tagaturonate reductase [Massiliimalia sp.]|jgi:tagaturonate reductase
MKRLSYETLKEIGYEGYLLKQASEKVIQFGEGNFLRGFADVFLDLLNEKTGLNAKAVLVQPVGKQDHTAPFDEQNGLYTLYLRGFENGQKVNRKRVISCVSRCLNPYSHYEQIMACAENPELRYIISNTTEAGIVYDPSCQFDQTPPQAFPAKLTQFLYRRFQRFGAGADGFVILPCELIDDNGKALKHCVKQYIEQWKLGAEFLQWVEQKNDFCSTLVDRIITGYPSGEAEQLNRENGYEDTLMDAGEVFAFWAIEGPEWLKEELLFEQAGLPVVITPDCKPYKDRKVRILNGAHTSMVLGAFLAGQDIVRGCMEDPVICGFMKKAVYEEIMPTLALPKEELLSFADAVIERFQNPFIDHKLLSISLNSTSKWKARVLPSLLDYVKIKGKVPECLAASFAFYLLFYHGNQMGENGLEAEYGGRSYTVIDDQAVLQFFYDLKDDPMESLAMAVMGNKSFWGCDLTQIEGFAQSVIGYLDAVHKTDIKTVMKQLIEE